MGPPVGEPRRAHCTNTETNKNNNIAEKYFRSIFTNKNLIINTLSLHMFLTIKHTNYKNTIKKRFNNNKSDKKIKITKESPYFCLNIQF
ncbi:hypothetical protein CCAN2_1940011 [Capnocytophaga canimorsus]|nr:hypothetical protein CCAN2_1940011 [Capnocytophaga canimorsus]